MNGYDVLMEEYILRKNKNLPAVDPRSLPTGRDEYNMKREEWRQNADFPIHVENDDNEQH